MPKLPFLTCFGKTFIKIKPQNIFEKIQWDMVHILLKYHCVNLGVQIIFICILSRTKATSNFSAILNRKRNAKKAYWAGSAGPCRFLPGGSQPQRLTVRAQRHGGRHASARATGQVWPGVSARLTSCWRHGWPERLRRGRRGRFRAS